MCSLMTVCVCVKLLLLGTLKFLKGVFPNYVINFMSYLCGGLKMLIDASYRGEAMLEGVLINKNALTSYILGNA